MADEFKQLISGFAFLGRSYCATAKNLAPSPDHKSLLTIYEAPLTACLTRIEKRLGDYYESLDDEHKFALNDVVDLSGILEMIAEATERLEGISDPSVLDLARKILLKIADFLYQQFGIQLPVSKIKEIMEKLWPWIKLLIRNISDLLKLWAKIKEETDLSRSGGGGVEETVNEAPSGLT